METDETMTKAKWPLETGLAVGNALLERLRGHCQPDCCVIAGSLRRQKREVGDVEILYVPKIGLIQRPGEMFESEGSEADYAINGLLRAGKLAKRLNKDGHAAWGSLNKLAQYVQLGAAKRAQAGKTGGVLRGLASGFAIFLRLYVFRRGFLCGAEGFLFCFFIALECFFRYAALKYDVNDLKNLEARK